MTHISGDEAGQNSGKMKGSQKGNRTLPPRIWMASIVALIISSQEKTQNVLLDYYLLGQSGPEVDDGLCLSSEISGTW